MCTAGLSAKPLNFTSPYPEIVQVRVAIEDVTDPQFVQEWASTELWGTPLYYQDALQRWPERHAAAISAIARAQPGGVFFHCARGKDRTGIITLLLLALAWVAPEEIVADYAMSCDPERDEILASRHTSIQTVLLAALKGLNLDGYLQMGNARPADLSAIRERLLG
jgi:hypothetical protein